MAHKQYIYRILPRRPEMLTEGPTESESRVLTDHLGYLERLSEEAVVLLAGRTQTADSSSFGIVIFTADSESEAEEIVANDPAVKHGLMDARLFPYRIAVLSDSIVDESNR